jgi:hypothetical protein
MVMLAGLHEPRWIPKMNFVPKSTEGSLRKSSCGLGRLSVMRDIVTCYVELCTLVVGGYSDLSIETLTSSPNPGQAPPFPDLL